MNFQPPDPEDDPRDDDQRMRDAELEAHRVRFEELWLKNTGFETQKDEKGYYYDDQQAAWFAYQWALADADRAQRAAPGVQAFDKLDNAEIYKIWCLSDQAWHQLIGNKPDRNNYFAKNLEKALLARWIAATPPQQSAQPGGEAVKLVDALLLEAEIFWWNDGPEGKSSDAMKAARDQVIVALSAAAQPVEVPSDFHTHKNAWRSALEMAEQNALVNPPDLDDKSYWRHEIAAFDRAYSELGAQPVEVQRVPLTAAEIEAIAKPFICTVGGYSQNEPAIPDNGKIEDFVQAVEAAHQIGVKK